MATFVSPTVQTVDGRTREPALEEMVNLDLIRKVKRVEVGFSGIEFMYLPEHTTTWFYATVAERDVEWEHLQRTYNKMFGLKHIPVQGEN